MIKLEKKKFLGKLGDGMKVLMLTIGGSDAPIIKTIRHHNPNYVVFFCTEDTGKAKGSRDRVDGEGLVCQDRPCAQCGYKAEDRTNIISRTDLQPGDYEMIIVEPDNPYDSYQKADSVLRYHLKQGDNILVDYTGGTKSMTVGLAVASMEYPECEIGLVDGKRIDTVKIRDGMERVRKLPINVVYVNRQMNLYDRLVDRWEYRAAAGVLEDISGSGYVLDNTIFDNELLLCRAFAAWDNFEYQAAVPLIELFKNDDLIAPYNAVLKRISMALKWYNAENQKSGRIPGFDLVYDILLNAERRSQQGNYDDAVSRTYRALEMYAQFCLRSNDPQLDSDDIDIASLPADIQSLYEEKRNAQGKVQLPLAGSYDLLEKIGHPVGRVWNSQKNKVLNVLEKRNYSFLAHGMNPIGAEDFQIMFRAVCLFIEACDDAIGNKNGLKDALQLPRRIVKE